MTILWSPRARDDRRAIFQFNLGPYQDHLVAAIRWDERLAARVEQAAQVPNQGHRPRELREDPTYERIRQVWVKRYRVIYEITAGTSIEVLRVFEGHRLLFPEDLR